MRFLCGCGYLKLWSGGGVILSPGLDEFSMPNSWCLTSFKREEGAESFGGSLAFSLSIKVASQNVACDAPSLELRIGLWFSAARALS